MTDINSRQYWDDRFATDWILRAGREQSRFFARIAVDHMPPWLVRELAGATVCDWGCAMGDGTQALAAAMPTTRWTGVDFAANAIDAARRNVPGVEFACRNLLEEQAGEPFDAVFSSNVLEHFAEPMSVMARLGRHARRFQIHLVPFREDAGHREPEHAVTFGWRNLPLAPEDGWALLHATRIDAGRIPDSHWHGEQMLLVFARRELTPELGLALADVRIDSAAHEALLLQAAAELAAARAEAQRASCAAAALTDDLAAARADRARLLADATALRQAAVDLEAIRASRIWRWTAWLRR
jgi:hypothetical protein